MSGGYTDECTRSIEEILETYEPGDIIYVTEEDSEDLDLDSGIYYVDCLSEGDDDVTIAFVRCDGTEPLTFSTALDIVKDGHFICRKGWNGTGMRIGLQEQKGSMLPYLFLQYPKEHRLYPDGCTVPWLASKTDILMDDWMLAPEQE